MFIKTRNSLQLIAYGILLLIAFTKGSPVSDKDSPRYMEEIARYAKSAEINNYLNISRDPCANFYNFVCSNYYKLNPPSPGSLQMQPLMTVSGAMRRKYLALLKTAADGDSTLSIESKVKTFFRSCVANSVTSDSYRIKIKEILQEFGGMPAVEGKSWNATAFDWQSTIAAINHRYGLIVIMGLNVGITIDDNRVNSVLFQPQEIPLVSADVYTDEASSTIRLGRQIVMAKYMERHLNLDPKKAQQVAKEIFDFETKLFAGDYDDDDVDEEESDEEAISDSEEISEYISNYTTVEEMHLKYYPDFDVRRFVNISFGYVPNSRFVDDIGDDDLKYITDLIEKTPKDIVANYIFFYMLNDMTITGLDSKTQEVKCLTQTKHFFGNILDMMVYREYITNQTEQDVHQMWQVIKTTFEDVLQSNKLHWMKSETRQFALTKLRAIKFEINSYQQTNFTHKFAQLQLTDRHGYLKNIQTILSFNALTSRNMLNQPAEPYDDFNTLSYTPAYIVNENRIKMPVGILQPYHFWSDYYPKALEFGTLGFLVAHELIHGFDEDGRFFDQSGNIHKWWDKDSSSYFRNHTKCFTDQYQTFLSKGVILSQSDSQSENIADNGGIRLAYEAYNNWYENALRQHQSIELETLPRLNYTNRQLFFISYGQFFCNANHQLIDQIQIPADTHAHYKLRVMVPLSNLDEFSREFNCPKGSKMNPIKKCSIY